MISVLSHKLLEKHTVFFLSLTCGYIFRKLTTSEHCESSMLYIVHF
jgi:hypothetical protein